MPIDRHIGRRGLEVSDLNSAALFFVFALCSLAWPGTGLRQVLGHELARGYLMAPLFLALGACVLLVGRLDYSGLPLPLRFVREFYPQLIFPLLFGEAILLSAPVAGGGSHDAWFAWVDAKVFGFDPARAFSAAFSNYPVVNETMFASYFSFYVMLVIVPWLPWLAGRSEVSRRQMAAFTGYMLVIFTFYIFFRVQGPKYWFPDLKAAWYDHFKGGLFTSFFVHLFDKVNLSGAAFPSSHVGVSIMYTVFAARHDRRLALPFLVLSALIMAATVYIYAHWVADVVGGILTVILLLPRLEAAYPRLEAICRRIDGRAAR